MELDGYSYILLRHAGRIKVYVNRCPHAGINLEWQPDEFFDRDGHFLQCATHGALFRPEDGTCVRGPCAGDALQSVNWEVRGGELFIQESGGIAR